MSEDVELMGVSKVEISLLRDNNESEKLRESKTPKCGRGSQETKNHWTSSQEAYGRNQTMAEVLTKNLVCLPNILLAEPVGRLACSWLAWRWWWGCSLHKPAPGGQNISGCWKIPPQEISAPSLSSQWRFCPCSFPTHSPFLGNWTRENPKLWKYWEPRKTVLCWKVLV